MSKVTIVDAMCGRGKTSWAIQHMNKHSDKRFIYITPFLDEVERVKTNCTNINFYEPNNNNKKRSKLESFNKLLSEEKNIVSTHALFSMVNEDTLTYLENYGYTLILDEVFDVIEEINISKSDREVLFNNNMISIDSQTSKISWIDEDYDGKLNEYRKQIENGDVYYMEENNGKSKFMFWTFPISILSALEHTYILTYMFKGQLQRYYYDYHNVSYQYKSVESYEDEKWEGTNGIVTTTKYRLCNYEQEDISYLIPLIRIYEGNLNKIGNEPTDKRKSSPLCKNWYKKNSNSANMDILQKNTQNYFINIVKCIEDNEGNSFDSNAKFNMWSTYKDYKGKVKGKGYKGSNKNITFVSFNARATNEYKHKTNLAYLVSPWNSPSIIKFFTSNDIEVNEDIWALSMLVQWIFRSAIREGKPINIYIPSERMRNLLIQWLMGEIELK